MNLFGRDSIECNYKLILKSMPCPSLTQRVYICIYIQFGQISLVLEE